MTLVAQPGQGALIAQASGADDADGVGHLLDLGQDVGGDNDRHALLTGQGDDELADLGHPGGSSPLVGSSRSMRAGFDSSAMASPRRCFMPME